MIKINTEVRVGIFVLTGVGLMVAFLLLLGDVSFKRSITHYVDFGFSGGLQVGAPVKLSGIKLGKIDDMEILGASIRPPAAAKGAFLGQAARPRVRATLKIDADAAHLFTPSSRLAVGTAGLIGEPYLELMPGTDGEAALPSGSAMRGVDSVKFHVMFVQAAAVLQAIGGLVGVEDDLGLDEVGRAVASLMTTLNQLIGERRTELGAGISDLVQSSASLRVILGQVQTWVGEGQPLNTALLEGQRSVSMVHRDLPEILGMVKGSLTSLRSLSGRADSVISDALLEEIVVGLRQTTVRVEALTADVQSMVRMMKRGEGTVGGLMQDPQVYDDLKEMLRDLKKHPWKMLWRD